MPHSPSDLHGASTQTGASRAVAQIARWLAPVLLGIVAFALVLQITDPPGPGLDPDALAYMGSAESFARLGEFRAPTARWWSSDSTAALAHFPPGFATALAVPVRLGMDPMQGARLVQALCAFVIVTTLVLLVSEAAAPVAAVLLATALFSMASMHEVHVSVLSEPLFLALLVLALFAMVRRRTSRGWPDSPPRWRRSPATRASPSSAPWCCGASRVAARSPNGCATPRWRCCRRSCCRRCGS